MRVAFQCRKKPQPHSQAEAACVLPTCPGSCCSALPHCKYLLEHGHRSVLHVGCATMHEGQMLLPEPCGTADMPVTLLCDYAFLALRRQPSLHPSPT